MLFSVIYVVLSIGLSFGAGGGDLYISFPLIDDAFVSTVLFPYKNAGWGFYKAKLLPLLSIKLLS